MTTPFDFIVKTPAGEEFDLKRYEGQPLLIVNTASHCGFATQFEGLQKLHEQYSTHGLVILGFPCRQFKDQEFDDINETLAFCQMNYNVTFPMFATIDVNGEEAHPLYDYLKKQKNGLLSSKIKWNFTKFLVDGRGRVIRRYAPAAKPENIEKDIR